MPQSLTDILIVVAAVFLLWLVIRLFHKPIRWILTGVTPSPVDEERRF